MQIQNESPGIGLSEKLIKLKSHFVIPLLRTCLEKILTEDAAKDFWKIDQPRFQGCLPFWGKIGKYEIEKQQCSYP